MNLKELFSPIEEHETLQVVTNQRCENFKEWADSLTEEQKNKLWESYGY